MHCHANSHALSQDWMWIVHCGSGFSKWTVRESFGIATCSWQSRRHMSRKQGNKFWMNLAFACNADGSEKKDLFFIGRSKKPRCFGRQGPIACGFYYHSNKMAWMTGVLFEE